MTQCENWRFTLVNLGSGEKEHLGYSWDISCALSIPHRTPYFYFEVLVSSISYNGVDVTPHLEIKVAYGKESLINEH